MEGQPIWVHVGAITLLGEHSTMASPTTLANRQEIRVLLIDENPVFLSATTAFFTTSSGAGSPPNGR